MTILTKTRKYNCGPFWSHGELPMGIRVFLYGIIRLGDESLFANISAIQTDPPACLLLSWRSNFKAWEHLCPFGSWPLCEKSLSRITVEHICGFLMCWRVIVNWTESIVFQKGNNNKKKNQMTTTFFSWWFSLAFFLLNTTQAPAASNNDQDHIVCNFIQNTSHVTRKVVCSAELIVQLNKAVAGENIDWKESSLKLQLYCYKRICFYSI